MKKCIAALLSAALLSILPSGCAARQDTEDLDTLSGNLSKAEQIEVYDKDFQLLYVLTTEDELDSFFYRLAPESWEESDGKPELNAPAEASFVFSQRPTETILGGKPNAEDRQELLRLTIYEDSDVAYVKLWLFDFHMKLPQETLEALRTAAGIDV